MRMDTMKRKFHIPYEEVSSSSLTHERGVNFCLTFPRNTALFLKISSAASGHGISEDEMVLRILEQWNE